jgi:hypothetical protein
MAKKPNNHVSIDLPGRTYHVIKPKLICRKSLGEIREYIYILVVWLIASSGFGNNYQRLGYFTSNPLALPFRSKKCLKIWHHHNVRPAATLISSATH